MDRIGIILHLYHIDLWHEFKLLIEPFKHNIKLYLSLCKEHNNTSIIKESLNTFDTNIYIFNNYGADISSFLNILPDIKEKYFIKLHTKKSQLGQFNHVKWRHILLHDLIGKQNSIIDNYKIISNYNNCGAIGNKHFLLTNNENYHSKQIQELCKLLNINYSKINNYSFFGGTMFMSHTELFRKHFCPYNLELQKILSKEKNKVTEKYSGTYSHALERIFGYVISYNHLNFYHPKLQYIKILNTKAPMGHFHMIKLYNNDCYLQEDPNVYGHIIDDSISNFTIQWYHMDSNPIQKYDFVDKATVIQN